MTITPFATPTTVPSPLVPGAVVVDAVSYEIRGRRTLDRVSTRLRAGSLVAVAGGSGSGKTTLLELLAGVRRPTTGSVLVGADLVPSWQLATTGRVGLVPQDDIIHTELPLRRTLVHACRLRSTDREVARRVDSVLGTLALSGRASVAVRSLSGGQRKRASIAVELMSEPEVLVLDEPTSGLDPVNAAGVIDALRALADRGITVVFTTHDPTEVERADQVLFLAGDGALVFDGTPAAAAQHFGVADAHAIYPVLASSPEDLRRRWCAAGESSPIAPAPSSARVDGADRFPGRPSWWRQWSVLTVRSAEVTVTNRLTLAILVGSPALVIAMIAMLFPAGPAGNAALSQLAFWMSFAACFFGVTFGLLQIVTERAVASRDRFAGVRPTAYLASKLTVLAPVLAAVSASLLAVLRVLDRLPDVGWSGLGSLFVTMCLTAAAGLAIGLAASAAVADPAQATLALPMICFPQVLFAGAVVPVDRMTVLGSRIGDAMATRWGFESMNHVLDAGVHASTAARPALGLITGAALVLSWALLRRG